MDSTRKQMLESALRERMEASLKNRNSMSTIHGYYGTPLEEQASRRTQNRRTMVHFWGSNDNHLGATASLPDVEEVRALTLEEQAANRMRNRKRMVPKGTMFDEPSAPAEEPPNSDDEDDEEIPEAAPLEPEIEEVEEFPTYDPVKEFFPYLEQVPVGKLHTKPLGNKTHKSGPIPVKEFDPKPETFSYQEVVQHNQVREEPIKFKDTSRPRPVKTTVPAEVVMKTKREIPDETPFNGIDIRDPKQRNKTKKSEYAPKMTTPRNPQSLRMETDVKVVKEKKTKEKVEVKTESKREVRPATKSKNAIKKDKDGRTKMMYISFDDGSKKRRRVKMAEPSASDDDLLKMYDELLPPGREVLVRDGSGFRVEYLMNTTRDRLLRERAKKTNDEIRTKDHEAELRRLDMRLEKTVPAAFDNKKVKEASERFEQECEELKNSIESKLESGAWLRDHQLEKRREKARSFSRCGSRCQSRVGVITRCGTVLDASRNLYTPYNPMSEEDQIPYVRKEDIRQYRCADDRPITPMIKTSGRALVRKQGMPSLVEIQDDAQTDKDQSRKKTLLSKCNLRMKSTKRKEAEERNKEKRMIPAFDQCKEALLNCEWELEEQLKALKVGLKQLEREEEKCKIQIRIFTKTRGKVLPEGSGNKVVRFGRRVWKGIKSVKTRLVDRMRGQTRTN